MKKEDNHIYFPNLKLIEKNLEKSYFYKSFSKIKNHPNFKDLNLTNEEIIFHRHDIKKSLDSFLCCGEDQKFCKTLQTHYSLKRNSDKEIILIEYKCLKTKDYKEISKEEIEKKTEQLLYTSSYRFTHNDAIYGINSLKKIENEFIQKNIENIGNLNYKAPNRFITCKDNLSKQHTINTQILHYLLIGESVCVVKSNELKENLFQLNFGFNQPKTEQPQNLEKTKKWVYSADLLIIVDLGLESDLMKKNYYLDFLPEILNQRHLNNKITQIFTPAKWEEISEEVNRLTSKGNQKTPILTYKLNELSNTINRIFSFQAPENVQINTRGDGVWSNIL